ncbi:MFS transporter [Crossiella cryophila]|uniref:MFS family permease n=1 Tax=Crossiella cryophila TaxID=43355 RepID=A0A7W7FSN2_9PSEU|nr:MFS transporter [Crossiella cryophila]MBB4676372.1 MFS family permease [Crossiella cryophila]
MTKDTARRPGGLLRQRDFRHLWAADVLSQLGTRVSHLALPLLAAETLHAGAFEVSAIRTLQTAAFLVLGLLVGAWCDRMRALPVLVVADLARAAAFCSIPVAAAFDALTLTQVYVAVLIAGVFSVFFEIAHQTYLPRLVPAQDLIEANAKLRGNHAVAATAAPTVAGLFFQSFGAPATVLVNAAGYLWSALWLRGIRHHEPQPPAPTQRHLGREITEGLRLVFGHPLLRAFGLHGATFVLFQSIQVALGVLFLLREINLSPGAIGLLSSLGLTGALAAALLARRLATHLGQDRTILCSGTALGVLFLGFPLTTPGYGLIWWAVAAFGTAFSLIVLTVSMSSRQQALCPPALLGRMNATMLFLVWGAIPVGSLLGGVLGEVIGLRGALWVATAGAMLAALWLVCSPLRRSSD